MSRVGKQPIKVPTGVKVDVKDGLVRVEGPKGKLSHKLPVGVSLKNEAGTLTIVKDPNVPNSGALHGLTRTLIHNMVFGVSQGFSRELEIVGVGYRAQTKGNVLNMTLGYSHPIDYKLPEGIQAKVDGNTKVTVTGADKMLVGLVAAKIRAFKAPEPYQGKGIKYANEVIIRKQGKAAGAK
ncbi:MAG: 50S ribosomal protein L6 [Deltaproteobacteria bacterium]|nr:50S ribosomal protein L6 [Deltaproteobacteria bacterium]